MTTIFILILYTAIGGVAIGLISEDLDYYYGAKYDPFNGFGMIRGSTHSGQRRSNLITPKNVLLWPYYLILFFVLKILGKLK